MKNTLKIIGLSLGTFAVLFLILSLAGSGKSGGLGSIDYNQMTTFSAATSTASSSATKVVSGLRDYAYVYVANTGASNPAYLVLSSTSTGITAGNGIYLGTNGGNYVINNQNQWQGSLDAWVITVSGTTSIVAITGK